jgi:hypothetical protein
MTTIKKFSQILESVNPNTRDRILFNLEEGKAICIYDEDVKYFYESVDFYSWIKYIPIDMVGLGIKKLYFVLIGRKLYHTSEPKFGGHEFEIFTPSFK